MADDHATPWRLQSSSVRDESVGRPRRASWNCPRACWIRVCPGGSAATTSSTSAGRPPSLRLADTGREALQAAFSLLHWEIRLGCLQGRARGPCRTAPRRASFPELLFPGPEFHRVETAPTRPVRHRPVLARHDWAPLCAPVPPEPSSCFAARAAETVRSAAPGITNLAGKAFSASPPNLPWWVVLPPYRCTSATITTCGARAKHPAGRRGPRRKMERSFDISRRRLHLGRPCRNSFAPLKLVAARSPGSAVQCAPADLSPPPRKRILPSSSSDPGAASSRSLLRR